MLELRARNPAQPQSHSSSAVPRHPEADGHVQRQQAELRDHAPQRRLAAQPERRAEMTQRANGGRTVPQIFIGDTHVGGCDDLYALERAGKLDPLLAGK